MISVNNLLYFLLILACFIQICKNASLGAKELKQQGLYNSDDNVEIFTIHNYKDKLYGKNHVWVIEFYSSWCGFCQRFAPSWKALATEIKPWSNLVKLGAVNCNDEENIPLCRQFEIMSYPTLLYFHEFYEEDTINLGEPIEKGENMQGHKRHLIEHIISEQLKGGARYLPDLQPVSSKTFSDLLDRVQYATSVRTKYVFLIIQDKNSSLGPEVILDLNTVTEISVQYAISNNTELLRNAQVSKEELPVLLILDEHGSSHILGKKLNTRIEVADAIRNYLSTKNIVVPDTRPNKPLYTGNWLEAEVPDMVSVIKQKEHQAMLDKVKGMGDVVFQMDLETALRYSLQHEVTSTPTITGDKLEALKAYLAVLVKYFPFGSQGQMMLNEIKSLVESSGAVLKSSEVLEIIETAEKGGEVFSSPSEWLGCSGSEPKLRGYPCGLWKVFHYLTVAAAERNIDNTGNPREVLDAMYGYIKYFFGCADCSQHFVEMADRRNIRDVSSYNAAVLWLWEAHNEVNKRLAGDQTEDPAFPKIQFPSKERCQLCKNTDDSWNQAEVFNYLKHMYSSINIRYLGSDTRILHMGLEGRRPTSGINSIFRTIDTTRLQEKDVRTRSTWESIMQILDAKE